jgi:beta-galactosidase
MPDSVLVGRLSDYVQHGGTLLLGVRSGFKTPTNLVTDRPLPGLLRELTGLRISSWQSLPVDVGLRVATALPELEGLATYWYEMLEPESASVLGSYEGAGAALAMNELGRGRVYTLGWYPDPAQARSLLGYLCRECGIKPAATLPDGVLAFKRGKYTVFLNFSDRSQAVEVDGRHLSVLARDVVVHYQER